MEKERRDVISQLSPYQKCRRWIWRKFDRTIQSDDIRELPDRFMYPIGFIVTSSYGLFFLFFVVFTYINTINTTYLAPFQDDKEINLGETCNEVPAEIPAATVLVDSNGNYEGSQSFNYGDAIYQMNLKRFVSSPSNYANVVTEIKEAVQNLGQASTSETLAKNILFWLTWRQMIVDTQGNLQTFKFVADLDMIFSVYTSMGIGATIQGRKDKCEIRSEGTLGGYRLGLRFDNLNYMYEGSNCQKLLNRDGILYSGNAPIIASSNVSSFSFDIRSFVVASSLHVGVFTDKACNRNISYCLEVVNTFQTQLPALPGQGAVQIYNFVDPQYEGMHKVECIQLNSSLPYAFGCTIKVGLMNAIPVFNLIGDFNQTEYLPYNRIDENFRPKFCECGVNVNSNEKDNGMNSPCQSFFFQMGLLVYNYDNADTFANTKKNVIQQSYNPTIRLLNKYQNNLAQLSKDAYNATIPRTSFQYTNDEDYENDFDFCYDRITRSYCTIISFEMVKDDNSLTRFLKALNNGSCSDQFGVSEETWDILVSNPPVSLVQSYKECRASDTQAIVDALGIALGNAQFWAPVLAFLLLFAYGVLEKRDCIKMAEDDKKFSEKDKRIVADTLINEILTRIEVKVKGRSYHEQRLGSTVVRNANPQIKGLAEAVLDAFHEEYLVQDAYTRSTVLKYGEPTLKEDANTVRSPMQISMTDRSNTSASSSKGWSWSRSGHGEELNSGL